MTPSAAPAPSRRDDDVVCSRPTCGHGYTLHADRGEACRGCRCVGFRWVPMEDPPRRPA